jgi:hypothetical protein
VVFNHDSFIAIEPTWDRVKVSKELAYLAAPQGGTEFNRNLMMTARYLGGLARPGARRAIIVLTDNIGDRRVPDSRVRSSLWESDVILSGLIFPNGGYGAGAGDLRPFAKDTGGELLRYDGSATQLETLFAGLRHRYTLLYAKPATRKGEVRSIRVTLGAAARARLGDVQIRARTGYVAGVPDSDGRVVMR